MLLGFTSHKDQQRAIMKTAIVIGVGPERGLRCSVFSVRA